MAGLYYAVSGAEHGDIPPLVLIHGAGSSHLCWPPEIRRLDKCRTLAIDLPGHGRSVGTGLQSIEAYTARLDSFLEALNIYNVVLVGHSMGAAIAFQAALNNPRRVRGLGMASGGAHFKLPADILLGLQNSTTYLQTLNEVQELLFIPGNSPSLVENSLNLLQQTRPRVLYGDFLACSHFDVRHRLSEITMPSWVITGNQDRLTSPASAHYLAKSLPNAELQIVPGAGHAVMLDATQVFKQGLLRLLYRVEIRQDMVSEE